LVGSIMKYIVFVLFSTYFFCQNAMAACDCGSNNQQAACTGNEISLTVGDSRTVEFTWAFNSGGQEALCGQFANGDYWVAPRSGESTVTLTSVTGAGSGPVSLDENPQIESMGLLSSDPDDNYGNYVASESLLNSLPLNVDRSTSLVAAIQRNESQHGGCGTSAIVGNCVEAYHVVTILDQVPENAGATVLRPSIDETNKELLSLTDFDFSSLPELTYIDSASVDELNAIRKRWSHNTEILSIRSVNGDIFSEGGRAFRANLLVDDYAAGVAQKFIDDVMRLMAVGNPSAERQEALAAVLTYGKDLYYSVYDDGEVVRGWSSGAGQHLGKFPPAVLFSALYADSYYRDALRPTSLTMLGVSEGPLAGDAPQELEQVNIGINGAVWGDGADEMEEIDELNRYWAELITAQCFDGAWGTCATNLGRKNTRDPHNVIDGPPQTPGILYMQVSAGPIRGFAALAHLVPEVCETINYPPLMEYTHRIGTTGLNTENDICAPPDPRESEECDAYRGRDCLYYGLSNTGVATWGPLTTGLNPQCVPNNSGGNTGQNGRFPALHGTPVEIGYPIFTVENNWDAIVNSATACDMDLPDDLIFMDGFEG